MKEFDGWNRIKKATDATPDESSSLFPRWRDLVGTARRQRRLRDRRQKSRVHEAGRGSEEIQPVLIPRDPAHYRAAASPYRLPIGVIEGKQSSVILSQLRNIDSKRLVRKIGTLEIEALQAIRKEASRVNFG